MKGFAVKLFLRTTSQLFQNIFFISKNAPHSGNRGGGRKLPELPPPSPPSPPSPRTSHSSLKHFRKLTQTFLRKTVPPAIDLCPFPLETGTAKPETLDRDDKRRLGSCGCVQARTCACVCGRACNRTCPVVPELLKPNAAIRKHQVRLHAEEGLQPSNPADACSQTKGPRNGTAGPHYGSLRPPPPARHPPTYVDTTGLGRAGRGAECSW